MEEKGDIIKKLAEREPHSKAQDDPELDGIMQILETADNWQVPTGRSKSKVWDDILNQVEEKDIAIQRGRILRLRIAIAACLLLLGTFAYYYVNPTATSISTEVAQTKEIKLPDGSNITLNSSSNITYTESEFIENRVLDLEGEAYFDVVPGSAFKITTGSITTEVLGTTFNIYARKDRIEVKCLSGKVAVSDDERSVELTPGQKVSGFENDLQPSSESFNTKKAISWIEGKFYYDNTPFDLVVNELSLQFGVEIKGTDFKGRFYSGYFDLEDLDAALKQVFVPMGYTYKVEDKTVYIQ